MTTTDAQPQPPDIAPNVAPARVAAVLARAAELAAPQARAMMRGLHAVLCSASAGADGDAGAANQRAGVPVHMSAVRKLARAHFERRKKWIRCMVDAIHFWIDVARGDTLSRLADFFTNERRSDARRQAIEGDWSERMGDAFRSYLNSSPGNAAASSAQAPGNAVATPVQAASAGAGEGDITPSDVAPEGSTEAAPGVGFELTFDCGQFRDGLLAALRTETREAIEASGNELYAEIGRDDPWAAPARETLEFLNTRENLLKDIPGEIHAEIEAEIRAGLRRGESLRELARRISDKFAQIGEGRAETIASTETAAAYGFARQASMRDAGVPFKRWLTSHLPNVRHAHAVAEGEEENQRVPVDTPFAVGGESLMYPGDAAGSPENTINCHCVALAVLEGDEA